MSTARVQAFLDSHDTGLEVIHTGTDTSTVETAAATLGVQPAQIAKTLAVRAKDGPVLVVARGDARLDNAKFRNQFGIKPRMLPAAEAEEFTGQPVGGVSPFGHSDTVAIYCDASLRDFDIVYPAGGSPSSAVRITPDRLAQLVSAAWVDVTKTPEAPQA
ncbi:MAG: YbaK/EbsC family protein [Propioniciclava sp.]|uniref:YbaK/EbsC family protein n=1 Tax=Propioniciclava sp. TaxID=2038686 RepID=UPI0039E2865B